MSVSSIPPTNQAIIDNQDKTNKNTSVNNLEVNNKQQAATKNETKKNTVDKENQQLNKESPTDNSAAMAKIIAKNNMV